MNNPEEILNNINTRRSVRNFNHQEISDDIFKNLIKAASMAPNGCKAEPWFFYVIRDENVINKMREEIIKANPSSDFIKRMKTFFNARYLITVCIDMDIRWYHGAIKMNGAIEGVDNPDYSSIAAAIQNLLLAAHSYSLGACWLSPDGSYREKLENILEIRRPYRLVANIAIGHYDEIPVTPSRRPLEEICKFI